MKAGLLALGVVPVALSAALVAASASIPLSSFVGKYPFDKIGGQKFLTHPVVRHAVNEAVWEPLVVREVLSEGVTDKIKRDGPFLITSSCRPHDCASVNWTLVIRLPKGPAAVCYHNQDLMGDAGRWYLKGQPRLATPNGCDWFNTPPSVFAALR